MDVCNCGLLCAGRRQSEKNCRFSVGQADLRFQAYRVTGFTQLKSCGYYNTCILVGIELDKIPISESTSIWYRYRNRVGCDTDIGIELDTIPISESSWIRYRYRNRVRCDTDIGIEFDTIPICETSPIRYRYTKNYPILRFRYLINRSFRSVFRIKSGRFQRLRSCWNLSFVKAEDHSSVIEHTVVSVGQPQRSI